MAWGRLELFYLCTWMLVLTVRVLPVLGIEYSNIALGKPTGQSGVDYGGVSSRAVDGDRNPNYFGDTCTHTEYDMPAQWWIVDLISSFHIHSVAITNRLDGLPERLHDFQVYVSETNPLPMPSPTESQSLIGQVCVDHPGELPASGPHSFACGQSDIGRYVYLYKPDVDPLTLCEFEVAAESIEDDADVGVNSPLKNIFLISSIGRKTELSPFHWKTIRVRSKIKCAAMCLSRTDGIATAVQFEESTGMCECVQKSVFMKSATGFTSDSGWELLELTTN